MTGKTNPKHEIALREIRNKSQIQKFKIQNKSNLPPEAVIFVGPEPDNDTNLNLPRRFYK